MKSKVLLLSMPFGALERQALGLSLFKSRFAQEKIDCDVRYLTFKFADLVGAENYTWISQDLPHTAFSGEWIFTHELYGNRPSVDREYTKKVLREQWQLDAASINRISEIRSLVTPFLDHCVEAVPWQDYTVVGFTSTFEQNIASLALARRIKERYPDISTVFGGGNFEDDMGRELLRKFPFIDFVCLGEADDSFVSLVKNLRNSHRTQGRRLGSIKGLVYRQGKKSVHTGRADLVTRLDALPIPDYTDYFRDFNESSASNAVVPTLLFEGSRGCWWGAKSHCTFCGLNGCTLAFRCKSVARVVEEVANLSRTWGIDTIQAVDNVIDIKHFNEAMSALTKLEPRLRFFWEVRVNMRRQQVKALAEAGIRSVQPGIESLNDHVLKLMRKGTSSLQNLQFLKWCKEYGIRPSWNLLYGFPGETRRDYAETLALLPSIRFLDPPTAWGPIRLDRFSPYYIEPRKFGLRNVRPMSVYEYLYPFDRASLSKIAYYFDYDYAPGSDPSGYADDVTAYLVDWKENPESGVLSEFERPDGALVLVDTRQVAARNEFVLTGLDRELYQYCDQARSVSGVTKWLCMHFPGADLTDDSVRTFMNALVANRLMVNAGDRYLSLALRANPMDTRASRLSGVEQPAAIRHSAAEIEDVEYAN